MKLSKSALAHARDHLLGDGSHDMIQLMHRKSLGWDTAMLPQVNTTIATSLDWLDSNSGALTPTGRLIGDACREYSFWIERDRKLPFDGATPQLVPEMFDERAVLEIGSGMGANLMSLAVNGVSISGVEPMEAYAQLGAILFEREGLPVPEVKQGAAEALPFPDQSFDVALCVSAHQYFDIRLAFQDIARILKPGGTLIIIGATFKTYIWGGLWDVLRREIGAKTYAITALDTFGYELAGRRIVPTRGGFSTARPIYLSRRAVTKLARQAEMVPVSAPTMVESETCFHFQLS